MLLERDADPYIHSSLYLRVTNGEVESCEEKRRSGKSKQKVRMERESNDEKHAADEAQNEAQVIEGFGE